RHAGSVYPSEQGFHAPAPRDDEARSELGERLEDEAPLVQAGVRNGEPGLLDLLVAVEQEIEIERPRAARAGDAHATEAPLDREQPVEELTRGKGRVELGGAVEEARLLTDAHRLGLAQARDGHHRDS